MDNNEFYLLMIMDRFCKVALGLIILLFLLALLPACAGKEYSAEATDDQELACTYIGFQDGTLISCKDHSMAWVEEPMDMHGGPHSPEGITVREPNSATRTDFAAKLDPCGDGPGLDQYVYRFYDGRVAMWEDSGLVVLSPGLYTTKDSQQCQFAVSLAGVVEVADILADKL